jgi:hypothetical protein
VKKGVPEGMHIAQTCLNEEDTPKVLFPRINKAGTVKPWPWTGNVSRPWLG